LNTEEDRNAFDSEDVVSKINKENQVDAPKPTNQKFPLEVIFIKCPANCYDDKAATNISVFGSK